VTDVTADDAFGIDPFHDFDINRIFAFPDDRQQISENNHIDRVWSTTLTFNSDISNHFFDLASMRNTTPEYVALTCYAIFLFKFMGQEQDFHVLQNVNHRVRFHLDPCASFSQQIHNISKILTCTMEYSHVPPLYTNHEDSTSSTPIFLELSVGLRPVSIMTKFNLRLLNSTAFSDTHVLMESPYSINIENDNRQVIVNLTLTIQDDLHENNLACTFHGCSHLLNKTTIETVAHRFHSLCQQLFCSSFDRQRQPIYELSILLPTERNMLQKLNNCVTTPNVTCCIHQAFIHQAILHPNKLAVTLDNQSLTYNQLLARVQQLTFILINDKNVKSGDIVCQYVDRSIEMIIGIMSIMMSGAIYAPLNPNDPLDRLEALIYQVNAKLVLVNHMSYPHGTTLSVPIVNISDIIDSYDSLNDTQLKRLSQVDVTPDSICHIVFTSGSTGIPKAVQIRHRNFMSYMETHIIQSNDIVLQLTSSSFDSHLDEIDVTLVRGAQLVLLKTGGHLDFDYMTQTIYDKKVTYVGPVPSWMNALGKFLNENQYAQERVKSVRYWYLGGKKNKGLDV
jgi:non-ribosomal peptide synthetase component F